MSSPALKVMFLGRPYSPQDTVPVASRDLAQSVGSWRKCWLVEVLGMALEGRGHQIQQSVNMRVTFPGRRTSGRR